MSRTPRPVRGMNVAVVRGKETSRSTHCGGPFVPRRARCCSSPRRRRSSPDRVTPCLAPEEDRPTGRCRRARRCDPLRRLVGAWRLTAMCRGTASSVAPLGLRRVRVRSGTATATATVTVRRLLGLPVLGLLRRMGMALLRFVLRSVLRRLLRALRRRLQGASRARSQHAGRGGDEARPFEGGDPARRRLGRLPTTTAAGTSCRLHRDATR